MKNRQAEDPPRAIETARVPIEVVHDPDRAAEITAALRAGELRELAKLGLDPDDPLII